MQTLHSFPPYLPATVSVDGRAHYTNQPAVNLKSLFCSHSNHPIFPRACPYLRSQSGAIGFDYPAGLKLPQTCDDFPHFATSVHPSASNPVDWGHTITTPRGPVAGLEEPYNPAAFYTDIAFALKMSEVLRSPSDVPSYDSSFHYPTSEEHATIPSVADTGFTEQSDGVKERKTSQVQGSTSPYQMELMVPVKHEDINSPTSTTTYTTFSPGKPRTQAATASIPSVTEAFNSKASSYTSAVSQLGSISVTEVVRVLCHAEPQSTEEYADLMCKIAYLVHEGLLEETYLQALEQRLYGLEEYLTGFHTEDPALSQLHIIVERSFDILLRISMESSRDGLSTRAIRFLSSVMINLNYWEVYNLLRWKPAIYQFLMLIKFDFNACYTRFVQNYSNFRHKQIQYSPETIEKFVHLRAEYKRDQEARFAEASIGDRESNEQTEDHDKFISDRLTTEGKVKDKKKKGDAKLAAHRVIKKPEIKPGSARLQNYDPDVIHECQLPSAEEPGKMCLRRFSRKYELIRHQDTVHLKKKKLFKCFVCVKQDPVMGPRIFTRHDTLAKHIRVNHRISGKEAKAEVAYSKKHAEIVDEGDITVHVGRRKTKVDFELRAHMNKGAREAPDGSLIFDDDDMLSGEEGEPMIDVV